MRKLMNVIGVGQKKQGVSARTDRPYEFTEIVVTFDDPYFDGLKAETLVLSPRILDKHIIRVGDMIDVVYHFVNYKIRVDCLIFDEY